MIRHFKLGALVAALGLAGLTQAANAAIFYTDTDGVAAGAAANTGDGLGSSFLFVASDGNGKSYLQSLNLRMGAVAAQSAPLNFSLPGLAAFFSGSTDAVWRIFAADTTGTGTYGNLGLAVGRANTSTFTLSNAAMKTQGSQLKSFVSSADGNFDPTPVAGQTLTSTSAADEWNVANLAFTVPGSTGTLANNDVLYLWNIAANGSSGATTQAIKTLTTATWTLNLSGNQLNFAPTPAPVPVPAAVWLLGSALAAVSGISRRRSLGARA